MGHLRASERAHQEVAASALLVYFIPGPRTQAATA
jgi:hypothetical protein